jgi:hypothetical protein
MRIKAIMLVWLSAWLLFQCRGDQPLSGKALHQQLLVTGNGEWFLENLTVDGDDQTGMVAALMITFTDTHFTAVNGLPVWPAQGSWAFSDESGTIILRDDQVAITLIEINEEKLRLELQWDTQTYSGNRKNSLKGRHVFTFKK